MLEDDVVGARRQGQIIPKGKEKWLVRYFVGRDSKTGRRKYQSESVTGKIGEAKSLLNRRLGENDSGVLILKTSVNMGEYLDDWVATVAKIRVRESTYESYKYHLKKYVSDDFRALRLTSVTDAHVQGMYNDLSVRLSPRTVRYVHSLLKNALKKAQALKLIHRNPCEHVDLPKRRKKEISVFSQDDARRFLAALDRHPRGLIFEFALVTGARPEEYLATKWSDIDFSKQTITFQRTLIWRKGGGWIFDERMKTAHSRRTLRLPGSICEKLMRLRKQQAEQTLKIGPAYERNGLIFTTEIGTPVNHRNLAQRDLKNILKEAGLGHFTLYSLRHSCATLLLAEGVNIKVIQERLGHADVSLTLSTYSHVLEGMQDQAMNALENILYRKAASGQR